MRYFKRFGSKPVTILRIGEQPKMENGKKVEETEEVIFEDWFAIVVGTDEKIGKSAVTLRSATRAIDAVKSTPEGDYVALEDEDYRLVESIMKEPKGYHPWVNRQLTDWMDEIAEAKKVKPGTQAPKSAYADNGAAKEA
jgi:hypothetical protein